jgi:hypothetical protein
MSSRKNHIHDLPLIAKAIQEYKTTHQTQKECAAKYGIPYKVFSYYFLNGFKKNQKVGGGLIPEETAYQKKAKQRVNNYDIVLLGGNNVPVQQQLPLPPQLPPQPVSHQYQAPPMSQQQVKSSVKPSSKDYASISVAGGSKSMAKPHQNTSTHMTIKDKMKAATMVGKDGKKRLDLDGFIFDA